MALHPDKHAALARIFAPARPKPAPQQRPAVPLGSGTTPVFQNPPVPLSAEQTQKPGQRVGPGPGPGQRVGPDDQHNLVESLAYKMHERKMQRHFEDLKGRFGAVGQPRR